MKGDGRLTKAGAWRVNLAATALRAARTRQIELRVVAEYGLSYGDSLQRARRRGRVIKRSLISSTKLRAEDIEVVCLGPDGEPRIEIDYR